MPRRLRILFFGNTAPLSVANLEAVAGDHQVVGLVCVRPSRATSARALLSRAARTLTLRAPDAAAQVARGAGARLWYASSPGEMPDAESVRRLEPDLICVSALPWKVPGSVLAAATLGGVNVHTSLLPRHRGPLPLFWIYHGNDRETGVTVHRMTDDYDAGEIVAHHAFPLERGYPVDSLHQRHVEVAPEVLRAAVRALADGTARPRPQDESLATGAPYVHPGDQMVNFDAWDVERVWHFLAGLFPRFIEPLADTEGRPLRYGGVIGFAPGERRRPPGTATRTAGDRLALHCRDGVVFLRATR